MQGRLLKSGPLSDPSVVETLNRDFIPVLLDPKVEATRGKAPGIALWEKAYASNWAYRLGFATSVVISSDGQIPLVASGIAKHHWRDVAFSPNHVPRQMLDLLNTAKDRQERYAAIQKSPPDSLVARQDLEELHREIIHSIRELSRGNDGRTRSEGPRQPTRKPSLF